ncbi:MAG TPA: 3'-5' exonuclease [Methanosarcinales archaeon]|nr:3'-5' exonuclease [Methanosarcinales archaeon]
MELFFDTETSGKADFKANYKSKQPWIVQLAMILSTKDSILAEVSLIIHSDGRYIEKGALEVHGINTNTTDNCGVSQKTACFVFLELLLNCNTIVCHNVPFDRLLVAHMLHNSGFSSEADYLMGTDSYCTMDMGANICKLPGYRGKYKWPKLDELYMHLFNNSFAGAHDALVDVKATRKCYYEMIRR